MPAIELTESVSGAPTTLALRKNSADSPSLLERGGVRSGGSASVASSVFNLANTIMGTGMLALPHAFATAGLASGLALCVVSAAANAFTNHLLTAASHRIEGTSLPAMAEAALPFWGGLVMDVAILLNGLGVCASYMIVATDSFVEVTGVEVRQAWTMLALALVAPLTLLRKLDSLRFTSLLAIVAVALIAATIVAFAAAGSADLDGGSGAEVASGAPPSAPPSPPPLLDACAAYDGPHRPSCSTVACPSGGCTGPTACPGAVEAVRSFSNFLKAFPTFVLAFGCQQNMLALAAELREPSPMRTGIVIGLGIGAALLVYVVVASAGYATFGDLVCSDILNSYPRNGVVTVARLLITLVVLTSYPLIAYEAKHSCLKLLRLLERAVAACARRPEFLEKEAADGKKCCRCWPPAFVDAPIEIAVAALFLLLTTSIALGVRDLGVIVGLVGASAGNLISFIVPAGSYFFLMPHEKWSAKRVGALVTLVAGIVLLPTCVAMVFIDT